MASVAGTSVDAAPRRKRGPVLHFIGRLFREKPLGAVCAIIFILFLFCGIFADFLAPYGYNKISPLNRLKPPSWAFPFGTDNLGRDMLSRCLYGAQLSVIIGFCAAGIATVISVVLGIVSGYIGGKFDLVLQRFVDAWMSFPDLIILIVVVSVVGPGMPQIIVTLGLLLGIAGSRIVRSAVVSVRENMYVHAAQSTGASTFRILWRHMREPVLTAGALLVMLGINVALGATLPFPNVWIVELIVASAMVVTILLFSMEVRHEPPLVKLFAGIGFFWVGILFAMTLVDYLSRA